MAMPDTLTQPRKAERASRRTPSLRVLAGAGLVLLLMNAALLLWLVADDDDHESSPRTIEITAAAVERGPGTGPVAVSEQGLRTLAAAFEQPAYWAGPRRGYKYSLRQKPDGEFYVRYLPPGTSAHDSSRNLLIVATYPRRKALAATEQKARTEGGILIKLAGGGVAYYRQDSPTNVYVAYPGSDYQIEVYDPSAERARRLILSGRIVPVR
jgi:hypothetical protein